MFQKKSKQQKAEQLHYSSSHKQTTLLSSSLPIFSASIASKSPSGPIDTYFKKEQKQ